MLAYKALEDCYNIDKKEEDSKPVLSYEPTPKPVSSTVPQLYMNPIHIQYVAVLVSVRYTLQHPPLMPASQECKE